MEKSLRQLAEEDAQYKKYVEALLWKEGHGAADQQQAGFRVIEYTGLTFVFFQNPGHLYDDQMRIAKVKQYQEALSKHHIHLNFFDEDPFAPYLCG